MRSRINEVIYGLRLCRRTHIDLKWVDKPAKEYVVEHLEDGTVVLEPVTSTKYVVRPTDDGQIILRTPINAKADFVQVRHEAIGLETKGQYRDTWRGREHPNNENRVRIVPWQSVKEEFPSGLQETGVLWSILDCESVVIRFDEGPWEVTKESYIPEDWDRSYRAWCDRPRTLRAAERREKMGEEEWKKLEERRERARQRRITAVPNHALSQTEANGG